MVIGNKKSVGFKIIKNNPEENIHLYIDSKLISNEWAYLPTYNGLLEDFVLKIKSNHYKNKALKDLSNEESLLKINSERNSNEHQYFQQLLTLDETIDQYQIFMVESEVYINITWKCWSDSNCNKDHKLNEIYSTTINKNELVKTLELTIKEIKILLSKQLI